MCLSIRIGTESCSFVRNQSACVGEAGQPSSEILVQSLANSGGAGGKSIRCLADLPGEQPLKFCDWDASRASDAHPEICPAANRRSP